MGVVKLACLSGSPTVRTSGTTRWYLAHTSSKEVELRYSPCFHSHLPDDAIPDGLQPPTHFQWGGCRGFGKQNGDAPLPIWQACTRLPIRVGWIGSIESKLVQRLVGGNPDETHCDCCSLYVCSLLGSDNARLGPNLPPGMSGMPRVSFDMRLLREQDVWEMLVVPVGSESALGY